MLWRPRGSTKIFVSKIVLIFVDTDRAVNEKRNSILWFNSVYSDQQGARGFIGPATDLSKVHVSFLSIYQSSNNPILSAECIALMHVSVVKVNYNTESKRSINAMTKTRLAILGGCGGIGRELVTLILNLRCCDTR